MADGDGDGDGDGTIPAHNAVLVAWSSPTSNEQAAELASWYDGTHIPEVIANVPGVVATRRYAVVDPQPIQTTQRLLTLYFVAGDVGTAAEALKAAGDNGRLTMTDTMDFARYPPVKQWAQSVRAPN
jgi:hypothetical protein